MKKTSWKTIKQIVGENNNQPDLFLSLINEDGLITCANATMIKNLAINDPRTAPTNFFDLIHPFHIDDFKKALRETTTNKRADGIELYIKNGHYHPMKWQVSYLNRLPDFNKTYLCVGYKIGDDQRLNLFNRLLKNNYHLIIEGVNGVIFHDINGNIIVTNQKVAGIFDTTLEKIYQENIEGAWKNKWLITTENGLPVLFEDAPFIKAARTGRLQTQTLVVRRSNGDDRWILFNSQPIIEDEIDGHFPVVSNIIDITSERQLSASLKERETLIRAFLQEMPDLAWVIDEEANLHFASKAFYHHFGLNEKDCSALKVTDIVPPAVTRAVFESHLKVFQTGKPIQISEKIKRADGSISTSHIHIFPITNVSGKKLLGGQAINVPENSNIEIEKELRDAQQRLLNFSRATSDAIWEWDMQNGQTFRNEALMEMIGDKPDNSKGLSWWLRRIHPEDRNRLTDKLKAAIDTLQQSWQDQYRFKYADGSYKHVQHKGFVVYENSLPVKMIGSMQNLSSIRELENELADTRLEHQKEIAETAIRVQENVNQLLSTVKLFFDGVIPPNKEQKKLKDKRIEYLRLAIDEIVKLSKELVTPNLKRKP